MADNYVKREKYAGLIEVDGQIIPQRTDAPAEELIPTTPENKDAHFNGGGASTRKNKSGA